jgi:hypothetical protein
LPSSEVNRRVNNYKEWQLNKEGACRLERGKVNTRGLPGGGANKGNAFLC